MNDQVKFRIICLSIITCLTFAEATVSIIPKPVQLKVTGGVFEITAQTAIVTDTETQSLGKTLQSILSPATGFDLQVISQPARTTETITLKLNRELARLGDEGYTLSVDKQHVLIQSSGKPGLFYGLVTLQQLLPNDVYLGKKVQFTALKIPCVEIEDTPRFPWRGMHLDVCRHFMPKEFIKKYIDLLALHKMNVFHWHLTEDQGWRIEIKKYPKLTEIGGWRKETLVGHYSNKPARYDGQRHGGFYTQDEIREIVDYAAQRYVTIVPEIEMPGHSVAALAAYPEFSCTGGPFEVWTEWGVNPEVYCVGNDKTVEFLQDVLTEVLALFPSQYIHIGGDECPKQRWENCEKCFGRMKTEGLKDTHELQSWFVKQMDTFLSAHGRRMVGWDEILEGGLAPGATVMSWQGTKGGIAAAKAGQDVVMAPNTHTYFDHYQAGPEGEPLAIGGFLPLEKVYGYEPVPAGLTPQQTAHILGAQGQVWTEYIPTPDQVEYMALPRMCALAEVVWTPDNLKDYDDFYQRLTAHVQRLKQLDVNFCPLAKPQSPPKP